MSFKNELDRRRFLQQILLGTGVVASSSFDFFLANIMINLFERGTAHAAGTSSAFEDFKYFNLVMAGGVPRYYWDLPINPNGNDKVVSNPMVINHLQASGGSLTKSYKTVKVGSYHMPYIWSANIPTPTGIVPMSSLASNMMIMRGIDLQIDSHDIDRYRQVQPVPGGISLSGLAADQASTPIPAVGRNGGKSYYKSGKGISYVEMSGTNPFSVAMNPFSNNGNLTSLKKSSVENAIEIALNRMAGMAGDKDKFLPSTFETRANAKKMMLKSFGNLQESFTSLKSKYENLISRSFASKDSLVLPGVDNIQVPGDGSAQFRILESEYFTGDDIRTLTSASTSINQLSDGMAIAEFMLTQGLSSSVNIETGNILKAAYSQLYNNVNKTSRSVGSATQTLDVHFTGALPALIMFSRYYKAVSACLYEFIQSLRSIQTSRGTLFDNTIISVNSEFNRTPRTDGSGADHGWQGSNYSIFSGMVDQLTVVGNIKSNNLGTWGLAAPLDELNGREAIIGNVSSTISNLLEVKSPTPNDQAFAVKKNGKVSPIMKSLKNVS